VFNFLGLSVAELQHLLEEEHERSAFLRIRAGVNKNVFSEDRAGGVRHGVLVDGAASPATSEGIAAYVSAVASVLASAREGTLVNAAALMRLDGARARLAEIEAQADVASADASIFLARLRSASKRLSSHHAARAVNEAASGCDGLSDALVASLLLSLSTACTYSDVSVHVGGVGDRARAATPLVVNSLLSGGEPVVATDRASHDVSVGLSSLREFRDDYVLLRREAHTLRVISAIEQAN